MELNPDPDGWAWLLASDSEGSEALRPSCREDVGEDAFRLVCDFCDRKISGLGGANGPVDIRGVEGTEVCERMNGDGREKAGESVSLRNCWNEATGGVLANLERSSLIRENAWKAGGGTGGALLQRVFA